MSRRTGYAGYDAVRHRAQHDFEYGPHSPEWAAEAISPYPEGTAYYEEYKREWAKLNAAHEAEADRRKFEPTLEERVDDLERQVEYLMEKLG